MDILSDREALVFSAGMAAKAQRYQDVIDAMKNLVVELGKKGLTVDERNLLWDGYKNKIRSLRFGWRKLFAIETKAVDLHLPEGIVDKVRSYELKVATELSAICTEAIALIRNHLIPCDSSESTVFYHRMIGDFYRYLVEVTPDDYLKMVDQSLGAYGVALTIAKADLPISNPVRLETILNHALLHYVNMGQTGRAFDLANNAILEATPLFEHTAIHQDSHKFFKYLKDNVELWSKYVSEDRIAMLKRNVCHPDEGPEAVGTWLLPEWTFLM